MNVKRITRAVQKASHHTPAQLSNALILRAERKLGLTELRSRPENVDIAVTKACNLKCTMCRDYETDGTQNLGLADFEAIAAQLLPTARRLSICSGGEPYLNRNLLAFLRIARGYKVDTWVLSNGMIYKEDFARAVVEEGLITKHGFSVDGIKPETVAWVRKNAVLEVIQKNIRALLALREQARAKAPEIVIRYAVMRRNIEELPEAVRYWAEAGVEGIDCNYLIVANGMDREESLYFHPELAAAMFKEAEREAARHPGFTLTLPGTVEELKARQPRPLPCQEPWNFAWIDTNGRVLPCYRTWGVLEMGRVYGDGAQTFEEVWNNETYKELRRTVNDDGGGERLYPYCERCDYRLGYGERDSHLGDEVWLETIDVDDEAMARIVEHRLR